MGHLKKRGETWSYWVELPKDPETGDRRQLNRNGFRTKALARAAMVKAEAEIQAGTFLEPHKLTFGEYAERWMEHHRKRRVSEKTLETYADFLRVHLKPAFGSHLLIKINTFQLDTYYRNKEQNGRADGKGGLSAQTLLHHHRLLHLMFEQAIRWGLLARNPADAADPPQPQRREPNILNFEQATQLWEAAADTRLYIPIILAVTMGMRRGEVLGLHWRDVTLEKREGVWGGRIAVKHALGQTRKGGAQLKAPKTDDSKGTVALLELTADALVLHQELQLETRRRAGRFWHEHGLVCPAADGQPWSPNAFSHSFADLMAKLPDLPRVTFHDLRHSHASLLIALGVHMKVISARLRHSSINITMDLYGHLLPGVDEAAAQQVNAAFQPFCKGRGAA